MKRLFIALLGCLCLGGIYSQDYQPFVDSTKMWSNTINQYPTYYIRFQGDTVINDTAYLRAWQSFDTTLVEWEICGFIREETDLKRVYFRNFNNKEGLMYDFGMQAGDSAFVKNLYRFNPDYSSREKLRDSISKIT
jgi:hypothetical protein